MVDRVVVFLDWQNVYKRARGAFCQDLDGHIEGQVDPIALGTLLAGREDGRTLTQVRIYRGIPTNKHDPKGYAANRRHTAAWMARSTPPHVYLRPLQYMPNMDPREKGIDVQLAIDFVVMAVQGKYDVGILFSTDTDLKPALDAVCELQEPGGGPQAEVAAWSGPNTRPRRITGTIHNVPCHWLDEADYRAVRDETNYGRP